MTQPPNETQEKPQADQPDDQFSQEFIEHVVGSVSTPETVTRLHDFALDWYQKTGLDIQPPLTPESLRPLVNKIRNEFWLVNKGDGEFTTDELIKDEVNMHQILDVIQQDIDALRPRKDDPAVFEQMSNLVATKEKIRQQRAEARDCKLPLAIFVTIAESLRDRFQVPLDVKYWTSGIGGHVNLYLRFPVQGEYILSYLDNRVVQFGPLSLTHQRLLQVSVTQVFETDWHGLAKLDKDFLKTVKKSAESGTDVVSRRYRDRLVKAQQDQQQRSGE